MIVSDNLPKPRKMDTRTSGPGVLFHLVRLADVGQSGLKWLEVLQSESTCEVGENVD